MKTMADKPQSLLYKKITDLTEISDSSLEKLFNSTQQRQLLRGEAILERGHTCDKILFVEKGYLRTFIEKDGNEINTDFVFENNFTTNLKSLRLATPSDTTIQAGENAVVYEFDKNRLLELYKESAEIESLGRKILEQLLINQEEHTNLFKIYSPTERYHYLQQNNPQVIQRISLTQIASYLGVARETLSRIRKKSKNIL
jgi:CRP-like cAMP-binding protein